MKRLITIFGLLAVVLFSSACNHLFYYPTKQSYFDPKKFNLTQKDIWLQTEGGEKIHAWLFESARKPALGTILFFHGNGENLSSHFIQLSWLPAEGYNFLVFDYPGYGQSSGEASQKGTIQAGYAAIDWLHQYDPQPLIIFGQSLGGAIAQKVIMDKKDQIPIKGIVLDSTFNSYQAIARKKLSLSWITWILQPLTYVLVSDRWKASALEKISPIPVLVIHGNDDRVVEPEMGERIFEQLNEPKQIWRIPGGQHTDVFWAHQEKYRPQFLKWLADLNPPANIKK